MDTPKIALFANKNSPQLLALRDQISAEGAIPIVLDIALGTHGKNTVIMTDEQLIWGKQTFDDIAAVHIRCTAPNTPPALPPILNSRSYNDLRSQFLQEQELHATTISFFSQLAAHGKLVINPLTSAYIEHDTKAQLYAKLRANGFDAPITLSTNSSQVAQEFIERIEHVALKPAIGIGSTRTITPADLTRLDDLHTCAAMMQERIYGDTIRVHIVADTVVLALRILSDDSVDSRTNTSSFEFYQLPEEEENKIVQANRMLGLHYAAWDLIASQDGKRFVYLDCNPGPYIMWTGKEYSNAVLRQLAIYMITFAKTGSLEKASTQISAWKPKA